MTLAHEQIAAMTTHEINIAITQRIGPITYDEELDSFFACEYAYDWSHAGRLLEMMADEASGLPDLEFIGNHWICCGYNGGEHVEVVCQTAPTAPEAIARCWLEWWEVTHD